MIYEDDKKLSTDLITTKFRLELPEAEEVSYTIVVKEKTLFNQTLESLGKSNHFEFTSGRYCDLRWSSPRSSPWHFNIIFFANGRKYNYN